MNKFKFRLDTLLKVRKMKEDEAQVALSAATEQYIKAVNELHTLEAMLEVAVSSLRDVQAQPTDAATLMMYSQYMANLKSHIQEQIIFVKEKDSYRQQCISDMEEAVKQRKVVEKLKQKRFEQFLDESQKEEQKFLDELALQGFKQEDQL